MADGHIKISSRIDNSKAKQDFKDLQHLIEEYGEESQSVLGMELEKIVNKHDEVSASMERNIDTIQDLEFEIENLQSVLQAHRTGKDILDDETLARANMELSSARKQLEKATNEGERLEKAMFDTTLQTERFKVKMDNVVERTEKTREATAGVRKEHERLNKTSSLGVGKLGRYAMALFSIRSVYGMLSKLSNQWLNSNTEAANQTKAQIESMSNMLANTLAPVIQWLVNLASQLMGYFAALLKVLFGVDITTKKASKSTGGMAKGAKATNKELKRMLTGFDEVEKLSSDTADNMAGGGGGGGGIDEISVPEPNTGKFEEAINRMKDMLLSIWNTDTMQSFFDSFSRIGSAAFESIKTLANTMWDNVVLSWEEASPFIFEGLENLVEYWRRVFEDIADVTEKWLPSITEKLATFIDNIFATFRPLTTFIAQLWRDFTQIMLDLWNEYGAVILDKIGEFIDNSMGLFNKVWTHIIDPIIAPAIQFMTDIWDDHLKDLVMEIGRFIGDLVKFALDISNKFIAPVASLFLDVLQPAVSVAFSTMFGVIKGVLGGMLDFIKITISSIRGVFNGLITFIKGVFTGNWRKAWQGVKDIFGSIVGGLGKMFIIPINIIIDSLNGFIRGLNKIKIPKWVPGVGGKGIDIQPIQRLQRGTVVNRPMPAMLGDGGAEAVIPLENDTRALEHIAGLLNSFNDTGQGGDIIVQIGNETVFKMMISELKKRQTQMNGGVVLGI